MSKTVAVEGLSKPGQYFLETYHHGMGLNSEFIQKLCGIWVVKFSGTKGDICVNQHFHGLIPALSPPLVFNPFLARHHLFYSGKALALKQSDS